MFSCYLSIMVPDGSRHCAVVFGRDVMKRRRQKDSSILRRCFPRVIPHPHDSYLHDCGYVSLNFHMLGRRDATLSESNVLFKNSPSRILYLVQYVEVWMGNSLAV